MTVLALESLPLGFRFHPTDEELVNHYLKGKITGRSSSSTDIAVIPEVDVCKCEPWDLPEKSLIKSADQEWFFFAPRDRKYPNGHQSNRATGAGYWKATGKDRMIRSKGPTSGDKKKPPIIGMKKTLVFHCGRAPKGERTGWIMHEYRTTEPEFECGHQGSYVLYRLFNKQEDEIRTVNSEGLEEESPSTSRSSPGIVQHAAKALEEMTASLNGECLPSILGDKPQTKPDCMTREPANVMGLGACNNDCSSTYPLIFDEKLCNTVLGSHPNETREKDDDLLDGLTWHSDLQPKQNNHDGFPDISSPMRPSLDYPFVCKIDKENHTGKFDGDISNRNVVNEFIDSVLAESDEDPSGNVQDPGVASAQQNSPRQDALFEDDWTTSDVAEGRFLQGSADTNASNWRTPLNLEELQMDMIDEFPEMEPQRTTLYTNSGTVPYNSAGLDLWGMTSALESPVDFNQFGMMEELGQWDNIAMNDDNLEGSGIRIADRSVQQLAESNSACSQQGSANRRIRLFSSIQRVSRMRTQNRSLLQYAPEAGCCASMDSSTIDKDASRNAFPQTKVGEHEDQALLLGSSSSEASTLATQLQELSIYGESETSQVKKLSEESKPNLRLRIRSVKKDETSLFEGSESDSKKQRISPATYLTWVMLSVIPFLLVLGIWRYLSA